MDQTMALLKIALFLLVFSPTTWASLVVKIGIDIPIHRVHSRYLSVTLDTSDLGKTPKFGSFNFRYKKFYLRQYQNGQHNLRLLNEANGSYIIQNKTIPDIHAPVCGVLTGKAYKSAK